MARTFFDDLTERILKVDSLLCVGLDPHPEGLVTPRADVAFDFCLRLIESTADAACAFKPNSAFFEIYGAAGWEALHEVIEAVPKGIPVILDAKRGDIASTAHAYARAVFELLGADAVTVNPYLGHDSLEPFLVKPEHGVFLLCKTSNPGAEDVQALVLERGERVYESLARLAVRWNRNDNLGLVVGATDPEALASVRAVTKDMWLLAPGIGAQGGDLEAALRAGLRSDGMGMIIPVSRGIARAKDPGAEAERLRLAINVHRKSARVDTIPTSKMPFRLKTLADDLLTYGCVRFGSFNLKSGRQSPIYFDLRLLASHPDLLVRVAAAVQPLLEDLKFDRLAAIPYAALPITTALSLRTGFPMVYPRKEIKGYGTQAAVEGVFVQGETVVLIDDLATSGSSKFEAIERLTNAGLNVDDVVVLIDRQEGARDALAEAGYRLHSVYSMMDLVDYWQEAGRISAEQAAAVREFLEIES